MLQRLRKRTPHAIEHASIVVTALRGNYAPLPSGGVEGLGVRWVLGLGFRGWGVDHLSHVLFRQRPSL